jgi:hypothetical protein
VVTEAPAAPGPPPPAPSEPVSPAGQVNFAGHWFEAPALYVDHEGRPAVLTGFGPNAGITTCLDPACETVDVRTLSGVAGRSFVDLAGNSSGIWWAAIRDDGSPVFAVVAAEQTGPTSLETTITLVTCMSPACAEVTETVAVRVSSDESVDAASGAPPSPDGPLMLALGPGNVPVIAFGGSYGVVTEINEGVVWKDGWGNAVAVAVCRDAACTGGADVTVLETVEPGTEGGLASARFWLGVNPEGLPIVAYGRQPAGETVVAACLDSACREFEVTSVETWAVTPSGGPGVALGADGLPIIAHWRWWDEWQDVPVTTSLISCRNASCSDATETKLPSWGSPVNLSTGVGGFPVLSFTVDERATLVTCVDPECSDYAVTTPLGESPYQGVPMIAVGSDGVPILAYYDQSPFGELHIHRCSDAVCTSVENPDVVGVGDVVVPDWVDSEFDNDSYHWAENLGLVLRVVGDDEPPDSDLVGLIVRQDPAPGTVVPIWTEFTIWLEGSS